MYTLKLEDFNYKINGNNLIFKNLINDEEQNVKLLDKYNIDGKDYIINEIDEEAFLFRKIKNVELPDTIKKIGDGAFSGSSINKFIYPPLVNEIPKECFFVCEKLNEVVLHDNIKKIGNTSFANTNIKKFICPKKVTEIPDSCFYGCKNLTKVELHNNIKKIESDAFSKTGINKFVCPSKVTEIPNSCFYDCENLTDVVLHDDIKYIGEKAFYHSGIKSFVMPLKITKIKKFCFSYCKELNKIALNNVNFIEYKTFYNCIKNNISYQNNKDIYIDNYDELIKKGFADIQINQIFKGYEKQIYLNNLSIDTPVDVFRIIINNFYEDPQKFSDIIKQLEDKYLSLNDKLNLYDEIDDFINDKNLDNKEIDHTI